MYRVKLSALDNKWPWLRQTPGRIGVWGDYEFLMDSSETEYDFWVVYEGITKAEEVSCPRQNVLLVTGEPPSIKKYDTQYLMQFSTIISCHMDILGPAVINRQQALPWMVGGKFDERTRKWDEVFTKDYDELSTQRPPSKEKLISVICSSKSDTKGHQARYEFIRQMKDAFPEVDVFGVGVGPLADKWDAIAGYKYHIVLENSCFENYWTEKLTDAYLGWAYPFYFGCPNILDYFPSRALEIIDIQKPREAIAQIKSGIAQNYFEQNLEVVSICRDLVLNKYNLFPMLTDVFKNMQYDEPKESVRLVPEKRFLGKNPQASNKVSQFMTRLGKSLGW